MTKEQIIEYAWDNNACEDGIRRFQEDEPLSFLDLEWAYEHGLDLGEEVYLRTVKENGSALGHVPKNLRTYELCMEAVKQDGRTLKFVPEEHLTYEICLEAVKNRGWILEYAPEKYKQRIKQELDLPLPAGQTAWY